VAISHDQPFTITYLDITRNGQDTGYEPQYGVERGMADYIQWLKAGREH
jgi:UDP-glucose 4-epimerase